MKNLSLLCFMFVAFMANAQTAGLSGKITGPQNEEVPYAAISIGTLNRSTAANANGTFNFRDLKPGEYSLTVTAPGYSTASRRVQLNSGENESLHQ